MDSYSLIGIPQVDTNIITFLTQEEYDSLLKVNNLSCDFFIFYAKSNSVADLSSDIASGAPTEDIEKKINCLEDLYVGSNYGFANDKGCRLVEVLANLLFALTASKLMYSQMYPYDLPFDDEDEDLNDGGFHPQLYEFGTLIRMTFYINGKRKVLFMNEYTFIDTQTILYEIGKE